MNRMKIIGWKRTAGRVASIVMMLCVVLTTTACSNSARSRKDDVDSRVESTISELTASGYARKDIYCVSSLREVYQLGVEHMRNMIEGAVIIDVYQKIDPEDFYYDYKLGVEKSNLPFNTLAPGVYEVGILIND